MTQKIVLIINTVKYLRPKQVIYRFYYTVRKKVHKRMYAASGDYTNVVKIPQVYGNAQARDSDILSADKILNNEFVLVSGKVIRLCDNDWSLKNNTYRLQCFRLNSFDWLLHLSNAYKLTNDKRYIDKGFELIDNWQESCAHMLNRDCWNAYVTANRIENWILFVSAYCKDSDLEKYAAYIDMAAKELRKSVEYQLGANHLLSEAKALVFAGVFLQQNNIYNYGKKLLKKEYKEQFLEDGGHYERSVSYHVESLQQYYEAIFAMNRVNDSEMYEFIKMIKKSYVFLDQTIAVDGNIPLFNDSAYDYPFLATDFLSTSKYLYKKESYKGKMDSYGKRWWLDIDEKIDINWDISKCRCLKDTGIFIDEYSVNDICHNWVMDVGNNGPDYNLGHTHADALSVLFANENKNIIVDTGVYTYEKCEARNQCRETRAHNTVEIDNTSNAQVWGAFRTAQRGHTNIVSYERNDNEITITAKHDGYRKVLDKSVTHSRTYSRNRLTNTVKITDKVTGRGKHTACIRYHIGPDCKVVRISDNAVQLDGDYILSCEGIINIVKCIVADNFGMCSESLCLQITVEYCDLCEMVTVISTKIEEK